MNLKEIEALIKFVARSGVSEVQIEDKEFKITIKTPPRGAEVPGHTNGTGATPIVTTSPVSAAPATPPVVAVPATTSAEKTDSQYLTFRSPMIGTFYRSSSPDKPSFVNAGDEIKPGSVLCIIEAMKLFNEIESEMSGKIIKVLVENATPVEYDQPLFLIDPS